MFEEIDYKKTPMGELSLRRRSEPRLGNREIYEVKLNEEFLMSSLFSEGEIALAKLGLETCAGDELDVVVGGLGLGYTAAAVLEDPRVRDLIIIETMSEVIDWHRRGLVPLGETLDGDARCRFIKADFFRAVQGEGFDPDNPARRFHAILLDIDHAPDHLLADSHGRLYQVTGLQELAGRLHPGGVFALWSNNPPDAVFMERLDSCFGRADVHTVRFPNPYTDTESSNTVYVARKA